MTQRAKSLAEKGAGSDRERYEQIVPGRDLAEHVWFCPLTLSAYRVANLEPAINKISLVALYMSALAT